MILTICVREEMNYRPVSHHLNQKLRIYQNKNVLVKHIAENSWVNLLWSKIYILQRRLEKEIWI